MLATILVFFTVLNTADSRTCLSCNGIPRPADCNVIAHCGAHESCYLDQHVRVTGHIVYDLGCRDTLHCGTAHGKRSDINDSVHLNTTTPLLHGGNTHEADGHNAGNSARHRDERDTTKICSTCCNHGVLCNNHGCGQTGYDSHRGPICMSCAQQSRLSHCNQIRECGRDEACYLEEIHNGVDLIYTTGCRGKLTCEYRGLLNMTHVSGREIPSVDDMEYPDVNAKNRIPQRQTLTLLNKGKQQSSDFRMHDDSANSETSHITATSSRKHKTNNKYYLKNIHIESRRNNTIEADSRNKRRIVNGPPETIDVNIDMEEYDTVVQHLGSKKVKSKAGDLTATVDEIIDTSEDARSNLHCASCCLGDLCIRRACHVAVNGRWSHWSHWSACSATCSGVSNVVTSFRTRSCSHPSPQNGGTLCSGDAVQQKNCTLPKCAAGGVSRTSTNAVSTATQSTICLSCSGAAGPRDCNKVEICGPNSVCFVDMHVTTLGYVSFYSGCRDKNFCQSITRRAAPYKRDTFNKDTVVCQECCSGNLCNNKGCTQAGYPTSIGPICYNCDQQLAPDKCNTITICAQDEACHLSYYNHVDTVFATGCKKKTECQHMGYLNTGPVYRTMVGRGVDSMRRSYTPCQKCCTSDLCNNDTCTNAIPLTTTMGSPIDGQWSSWLHWSTCSATVANTTGIQTRTRTCTNPPPQNGGRTCSGTAGVDKRWCNHVCLDPVIVDISIVLGLWTIGDSVMLKCVATSVDGEAKISWSAPISTGVTDMEEGNLFVTNIRAANAGTYTCTAQNDCGHVSQAYNALIV